MKRKICAIVVSLMTALTISANADFEVEPELILEAVKSSDGQYVTATVSINDCDDILGMQFSVIYDYTLLEATGNPNLNSPWSTMLAATNIASEGDARIAVASAVSVANEGGQVASIIFEVPDDADGQATLYIKDVEIVNKDSEVYQADILSPIIIDVSQDIKGNTSSSSSSIIVQSIEDRISKTMFLEIGNYAAVYDGELLYIDSDDKNVVPYINDDYRTMVPIRFLAETLDAEVLWEEETEQITINYLDDVIIMTLNSTEYSINGVAYTMDTAPERDTESYRTLVPVRFIAEAFDLNVDWNEDNQLVIITEKITPWYEDGKVEKEAILKVTALLSPLYRDFGG